MAAFLQLVLLSPRHLVMDNRDKDAAPAANLAYNRHLLHCKCNQSQLIGSEYTSLPLKFIERYNHNIFRRHNIFRHHI
jgi:hypothetical protein